MDNKAKHKLLKVMGYKGPASGPEMDAFIQSNPGVASKMGQFMGAARKFNQGGFVLGNYQAPKYKVSGNSVVDQNGTVVEGPFGSYAEANNRKNQMNAAAGQTGGQINPTGGTTSGGTTSGGNTGGNTGGTTAPTGYTGTQYSDAQINQAYNYYLGRDADQAGSQFYKNLLNTGQITPQQFQAELLKAQQNQGQEGLTPNGGRKYSAEEINAAYKEFLGRDADRAGLLFYQNLLNTGQLTPEQFRAELTKAKQGGQSAAEGTQTDGPPITQQMGDDVADNQRLMSETAYKNPQDLVTGQKVASMTVNEGEEIAQGTGQLQGDVRYDAAKINDVALAQAPEDIGTATYEADKVSQELQQTLEGLEAATADPSKEATVRGQLELLMQDFEDGNPPWAQGAMREASAIMARRGLGASSMTGQAITQAALEAATEIARSDAQTFATFELRNLDNRQQTAIFKAQQRITGLFTDQAAENASRQFNASSENQTRQFMASLEETVSRFNASQINAVNEINTNAENAARQFNAQMKDLREKFNAQNSLVIAQANAQWRQNINTINTAAQNDANREYVRTVNGITTAALDQLWQRERDLMTYAFTASESQVDREMQLLLADRQEDMVKWQQGKEEDAAKGYALTKLASDVLFGGGGGGGGLLGGLFG